MIVGKLAEQIAAGAGLVPPPRRRLSTPTFYCTVCDVSWPGTACADDPTHAGRKHGSAAEARWYVTLEWREVHGEIRDLRPHPRFTLPGGIVYTADAEWWEGPRHCVGEYKSKYTAKGREWRRTRKLFQEAYPALVLVEVVE